MERNLETGTQTTKIIHELMLIGELDHEMKNRLVEIGGRCPVPKTLAQALNIEIRLK